MSRGKQALLLLGALAAVTAVIYWAWRSRPEPPAAPETLAGLSWLPAESGLVAGIDLAAVRQQPWLGAQLGEVAGGQTESADYRAFVAATGFDYTRDLDRVWLGVRGSSEQPTVAGVAEGRFVRDKILAHARQQRATLLPYRGLEVYEVETRQEPRGRFAFAFLDDSHVAFGSDAHAAAQVVDCWQGRAPAVGADAGRRAALERRAAGQNLWAVDELEKWQPQFLRAQADLQAVVVALSVGLRVSEQGLALEAEARCREPQQARQLHDNLRIAALAGRLALARQPDRASRAVGEALGNLTFTQEGDAVHAQVLLPPALVAALLGSPAPSPARR